MAGVGADLDVYEIVKFFQCAGVLLKTLFDEERQMFGLGFGSGIPLAGAEVDDLAVIVIHDALHGIEDRLEYPVDVWPVALRHDSGEVVDSHPDVPP